MNKQYYLVDCKGVQIDKIQSLIFTQRQISIPIVNHNLDEILEARKNNREQIKLIYIKSPLMMRYENIKKENNDIEQVLNYITDDIMIGRKMIDIADLVVENNTNTKLNNVVAKIWEYIRECEKED